MPTDRAQLEERENQWLAPWAERSQWSRGRVHTESPPTWRTAFQRDRDRIIHSRAFRRLEYKTQVFLNGTGDHLRTRLTHTMEVAAIARNISRALRLNEDLAESIALAHDLGHAPFGHTGEEALNEQMRQSGGFEHNLQSLRVVDELEHKYPRFPGLNLSWEVREGLMKHQVAPLPLPSGQTTEFRQASLEAQVANLSDEIAYYSHDLDDGLDTGLLDENQLLKEVSIWADAAHNVRAQFGELPDESRRYYTIRQIIDEQVIDVVQTTEESIRTAGVSSPDAVRGWDQTLVRYSPSRREQNLKLRKYLYRNLYYNEAVAEPNRRAARQLTEVFQRYQQTPGEMDPGSQARIEQDGLARAVCDCVASMTDRFCMEEHRRLFGEGSQRP